MPFSENHDKVFQEIRDVEFSRLDTEDQVYLDYTGSGLYPESSLRKHFDILQTTVLGNPHSSNPTSQLATSLIERTRLEVLKFFNADPQKYEVIFTANASSALKIVGECYPFMRGSTFALLEDNHNSVHGIREYARTKGAKVTYLSLDDDLRASQDLEHRLRKRYKNVQNLFAYPAQSNFSGVKHPLALIHVAHSLGYHVLLDAAAFVPTSRLDLHDVKPDYVTISFYKMFGFPTGIGALIARKHALRLLKKPWFAGGTVQFVSVQNKMNVLQGAGAAAFEDGTVNFLGIPAIMTGLSFLTGVGMERIGAHVNSLAKQLIRELLGLRHTNGRPVIKLHGPRSGSRGAIVNFDMLDTMGKQIDPRIVERAANKENISLRTGCFCNPGATERVHGLDKNITLRCILKLQKKSHFSIENYSRCAGEVYLGSIRVSLGLASNTRDLERFLEFVEAFSREYDAQKEDHGAVKAVQPDLVDGTEEFMKMNIQKESGTKVRVPR